MAGRNAEERSKQRLEKGDIMLFNPKDKPFGELSNNALTPMTIDRERWDTVTNYIYGMALRVSTYQTTLQTIPVSEVKEAFVTLSQETANNTITWAAEEGLNVKFKDPKLIELLLSTGSAEIKYVSPNPLLGIGPDGKGENRYGKLLMQMRTRMQNASSMESQEKDEEAERDIVYTAYMANQALRQAVRQGDANLSGYRGLTPSGMLDQYRVAYSIKMAADQAGDVTARYEGLSLENMASRFREHVYAIREATDINASGPLDIYEGMSSSQLIDYFRKNGTDDLPGVSKDAVWNLYTQGYLDPAIKYSLAGFPSALIAAARRSEIAGLRTRQLRKKRTVAFDLYLDYLLAKEYPLVQPDKYALAIMQAKHGYSQTAIMTAEDDLYELYVSGELPNDLESRIASAISNIVVPSPEEVREAEAASTHPQLSVKSEEPVQDVTSDVNIVSTLTVYLGQHDPMAIETIPVLLQNFRLDEPVEDDVVGYHKRRAALFSHMEKTYNHTIEPVLEQKTQTRKDSEEKPRTTGCDLVEIFPKPPETSEKTAVSGFTFQDFSPLSYTGMLIIEGYKFPSITHYILYRLLSTLSPRVLVMRDEMGEEIRMGGKIITAKQRAYMLLLVNPNAVANDVLDFLPPPVIQKDYEKRANEGYTLAIKENAMKALDVKFQSRYLQDLLLDTGNSRIVYTDRDSSILGIGKNGKGENLVGNYLMGIRSTVMKERKEYNVSIMNEEDVSKALYVDPSLRSWMMTRVSDTCRAVNTLRNYMYQKHGVDQKLTAPFVRNVLNDIYYPCEHLYAMSDQITMSAPGYFKGIIKVCPGWKDATNDVINVIWRRVAVMIYLIIKETNNRTSFTVASMLSKAARILAQEASCKPTVPDISKSMNCIVSALINILEGIGKLNRRLGYTWVADETDVITAAQVILDRALTEEKGTSDDIEEYNLDGDLEFQSGGTSITTILLDTLGEEAAGNVDSLANMVLKQAEVVDGYNVPEHIKRGRINFFANIG